MTNEQIKQNAVVYAELLTAGNKEHYRTTYTAAKEGYETGAHSRDEEIEHLKKAVSSAQKGMAKLAEMIRNPWISVEERLPENHQICFVYIKHKKFGFFFDTRMYFENFGFVVHEKEIVTHWMPIPEVKGGEQ